VTIILTRFQDVPTSHPSFSQIEAIAAAGITRGCQADDPATLQNEALYCYGNPVTRGQSAAFIIRALNGADPVGGCAQQPFSDVPVNHIFCTHIEQMTLRGITLGIGDGTYKPDLTVTRGELAAFLVRAKVGEPAALCTVPPFPDVAVDNLFCRYIENLKLLGITLGFADGTYRPLDVVTREQMAVFLGRAFLGLP
jgi:hypothetical protein